VLNVATVVDAGVANRAAHLRPLPADGISRRENAFVYGARVADEPHPLALGPWNELNDFTHIPLQIRLRDDPVSDFI
jgi:hypothetical protein